MPIQKTNVRISLDRGRVGRIESIPSLVSILVVFLFGVSALSSKGYGNQTDAWIFSGQSNMKSIGSQAQKAVGKLVEKKGRRYYSIYVAQPGKPIEAWIDSTHRDYKLWTTLEREIAESRDAGHNLKGFVWYQGESNVNSEAGQYLSRLRTLVARVRSAAGNKSLPVIVVQIGAATAYDKEEWAVGVVREAQRRFAESDANAVLVTAINAELKDFTVHLNQDGAERVADCIAKAADRVAYGNHKASWGPKFSKAFFADDTRREVFVEFKDVKGNVLLSDDWLAGFFASSKTALPEKLSQLQETGSLGRVLDDVIYPRGGIFFDERRILLTFDRVLPTTASLSYAATRNAMYGPNRSWTLEFGGLSDATGHGVPAFTLVPIGPANPELDALRSPEAVETPVYRSDWKQLAVNCVGRFPEGALKQNAYAGVEQNGWRQVNWNSASAGTVPNLFDRDGRVTGAGFRSGVWYMNPHFRDFKTPDEAMMAGWCKNQTHAFIGLEPETGYDLQFYFLNAPSRASEKQPESDRMKIEILQIPQGRKLKDAVIFQAGKFKSARVNRFKRYQSDLNSGEGVNVFGISGVAADRKGTIEFRIQLESFRNRKTVWADACLSGVQIRRTIRK